MVQVGVIDLGKLKSYMDEKRYKHTLGVAETAARLAQKYSANLDKAKVAALLHDCARCYPPKLLLQKADCYGLKPDPLERLIPDLLHGKVGAEIARAEFGITDSEILAAIRVHTLGAEDMSVLDKILFVADMIEPGRRYPGLNELRTVADSNLDEALLAGLNSTIKYVIRKEGIIHPISIKARNALLISLGKV